MLQWLSWSIIEDWGSYVKKISSCLLLPNIFEIFRVCTKVSSIKKLNQLFQSRQMISALSNIPVWALKIEVSCDNSGKVLFNLLLINSQKFRYFSSSDLSGLHFGGSFAQAKFFLEVVCTTIKSSTFYSLFNMLILRCFLTAFVTPPCLCIHSISCGHFEIC